MKRHTLHLLIGLGSALAGLGGAIARAGVELEQWGIEQARDQHAIYHDNDVVSGSAEVVIDTATNGGTRRVPHPRRAA